MKRFRLLFLVAGAVAIVVLLALIVVFNSTFQTWVARRMIAEYPDLHVTVGSVSVGLKRVEVQDVRFVQPGFVLTVPSATMELPVIAAGIKETVHISRLAAKGWTLDLTVPATPSAPATSAPAVTPPPAAAAGAANANAPSGQMPATVAVGGEFDGFFRQLRVPFDLSIDNVNLEGEVILPGSRGRASVTLAGGGLAVGREGRFDVRAVAALAEDAVKSAEIHGTVVAGMDSPRSVERLGARLQVSAAGTKFPEGVTLHAELDATRNGGAETYAVSVTAADQDVFTLRATLPEHVHSLAGTWKVNVRDRDVAPFAWGVRLPVFAVLGEGNFSGDGHFKGARLAGRLNGTLDQLDVLRPQLAAVGQVRVETGFELAARDGTIGVERLEAAIAGTQPVASVHVLQPFEINTATRELRTGDLTRELVGVTLQAVPVAWLAPWVDEVDVKGGYVRGELAAMPHGGGLAVRSTVPLQIDGLTVGQAGRTYAEGVDLALSASADYTPKGWQAELGELKVTRGPATLVSLATKVGQLAGVGEPLKATGTLKVDVPSVLQQPALAGTLALTHGDAALEFVLSLGEKKQIQASLALAHLATMEKQETQSLPAIATELRADLAPDGKIAFNAPIRIEREGRTSDLTVIGTIGPMQDKMRALDATVTSVRLVVEDAQLLAAMLPKRASPGVSPEVPEVVPAAPKTPVPEVAPPWAGLHGALALELKSVVYSDAIQVRDVTGRLRMDAGMLKLEAMHAGLGEGGRANANGRVTFDASAPQPYELTADVALQEFDPGPLFRAMTGSAAATVEGKFDVTSTLAGRAATLAELASGASGDFQFTSKGGVFRGLPVDVSNLVENTSKLAAWLASAGTAISAIAGKKDYAEVTNKAQAVAELARGWNPIPYDQLSVSVVRTADLNTTLRDFTLISPELRLTGSGTAFHQPGSCVLKDSLAMEFTLRARGRQGELLKYLGALDAQTDDLGYATCTVPLRISGSLGNPDPSEINSRLTALAIEKSGFGDKANELLNKIRGGK